jgi:hypothetical protein
MPKRPTPPRRQPQGRTDARATQPQIRTAQQPGPALMRGLGAIIPGMGLMGGTTWER